MKNLLLVLSLSLVATFSFGTRIPSPRGSGAGSTTSNETTIETENPTTYIPVSCHGALKIENLYNNSEYVFYKGPVLNKNVQSTLILNKVYVIDNSGIITDSLAFTTSDSGATYDINLSNLQPDALGRFQLTLKFKSVFPNQYTSKPFYVLNSELLQLDCLKYQMAWKAENATAIEVRDEVERFKILSGSGEVIVPETNERSVNIDQWKDNKYVVVEVLAPAALAGKYRVELGDDKGHEDSFVYPNPTSDFIKLNEAVEYCVLKDEKGEIKGEFKNVKEIDIREFGDGTYYLQIITDDKLIKTHRVLIKR